MKFVVTGAVGHVSKPLTELLLKKGHDVTVVGRSPKNLEGLVKLGAKTAIGDMGDVPFLTETLKRADGVYLMLPPCGIPMIRRNRASGTPRISRPRSAPTA
jgi:uncharacterized protein YbjT (DUF2867 family)